MNIENLMNIANAYEEFNFTLWNIYIAVVIAILAYSIGKDKVQKLIPRVILAAGFVAFAWGNLSYLERNRSLVDATAKEIVTRSQSQGNCSTQYKEGLAQWAESQPASLVPIHLIIDLIVVALVLFGPYLLSRTPPQSPPKSNDDDQ